MNRLMRGNVIVELENTGEGLYGEFGETSSRDVNVLRFSVYMIPPDFETLQRLEVKGVIEEGYDFGVAIPCVGASYATQLPANITDDSVNKALEFIMDFVYPSLQSEYPIASKCEQLSWLSPRMVDEGVLEQRYDLP